MRAIREFLFILITLAAITECMPLNFRQNRSINVPHLNLLLTLENTSLHRSPITLATHTSIDRLFTLEQQCASWAGTIVAAVYAPLMDEFICGAIPAPALRKEEAIAIMKQFYTSQTNKAKGKDSCSLIINLVSQDAQAVKCTLNGATQHSVYPVYAMRNWALSMVDPQDGVLLLDSEIIPSASLSEKLLDPNEHNSVMDLLEGRRALVVPVFPLNFTRDEANIGVDVLQKLLRATKEEFLDEYSKHRQNSSIIDGKYRATNYTRWNIALEPYKVGYEWGFEPIYVSLRRFLPCFDENLSRHEASRALNTFHFSVYSNISYLVLHDAWAVQLVDQQVDHHLENQALHQFVDRRVQEPLFAGIYEPVTATSCVSFPALPHSEHEVLLAAGDMSRAQMTQEVTDFRNRFFAWPSTSGADASTLSSLDVDLILNAPNLNLYHAWNSTTANEEQQRPLSMDLVTHCSLSRLYALEAQCSMYRHTIIAAIYAPTIDGVVVSSDPAWDGISLPKLVQKLDAWVEQQKSSSTCDLKVGLYTEAVHSREAAVTLYPSNSLRNRALEMAESDIVFLLDVDFVPAANMTATWQEDGYQKLARTFQKGFVVVVPTLEYMIQSLIARDEVLQHIEARLVEFCAGSKDTVAYALHSGELYPFKSWHYGDILDPVQTYRWSLIDKPFEIEWQPGWAPSALIFDRKTAPCFDERFRGSEFGVASFVEHLSADGKKFVVAARAFAIHLWHEREGNQALFRKMYAKELTLAHEIHKELESSIYSPLCAGRNESEESRTHDDEAPKFDTRPKCINNESAPNNTAPSKSHIIRQAIPSISLNGSSYHRHSFFLGSSPIMSYFHIHSGALRFNATPHVPHSHEAEEILILREGSAMITCMSDPDSPRRIEIQPNTVVYHPRRVFHTITATSPSTQFTFLFWMTRKAHQELEKPSSHAQLYDDSYTPSKDDITPGQCLYAAPNGTSTWSSSDPGVREEYGVWSERTWGLDKLSFHESIYYPGFGYDVHVDDDYDLVLVMINGEMQHLPRNVTVKKGDTVFIPAGEQHGMINLSKKPAKFYTFELHLNHTRYAY